MGTKDTRIMELEAKVVELQEALRQAQRIAQVGVGPDTTPEQAFQTIDVLWGTAALWGAAMADTAPTDKRLDRARRQVMSTQEADEFVNDYERLLAIAEAAQRVYDLEIDEPSETLDVEAHAAWFSKAKEAYGELRRALTAFRDPEGA